jgi:hypothetical protein
MTLLGESNLERERRRGLDPAFNGLLAAVDLHYLRGKRRSSVIARRGGDRRIRRE